MGIARLSKSGFVGSIRLLQGGAFDILRLLLSGFVGFCRLSIGGRCRLLRGVAGIPRLSVGGFVLKFRDSFLQETIDNLLNNIGKGPCTC